MSLKIVYVGTLPPHPGGTGIVCGQVLRRLVAAGHAVRALAPITAEALMSGDELAAQPGIEVARFLVPHFDVASPLAPAGEYRRLEREQILDRLGGMLARERPDLIFVGREGFAWAVPDVAQAHGLPSAMLFHGGAGLRELVDGTYPEARVRQMLGQFRKVDLVLPVAGHLTEGLRGLGIENLETIRNGADVSTFAPRPKDGALLRELAIGEGEVVVLHLANIQPRKRSLDVVHSAGIALRRHPGLVYLIVGDGVQRAEMERLCAEKGIAGRFRFVGWIDHDRVSGYVNLADIVVAPSASEGLALVYLEAQACARLLLASDIPAAREVVVDGETGLLFEVGDVEALAAKTVHAAECPELRARIGRAARDRAMAHSLDSAVAAYVATFERLVRRHRPTS